MDVIMRKAIFFLVIAWIFIIFSISLRHPFVEDDMVLLEENQYIKNTRSLVKIFGPFFNTKGEAGLGLTISKDIINNHHGKIELKTEEGKGTTFTVYLPKTS